MREEPRAPELQDAAFAENVKRLREQRGLSKAEMVRLLREAGWENVHQTTVTRMENGERPARIGEARIYASVLGTTVENLVREPRQAVAEDWLVHDIRAVRNLYNGIVDGVSQLLDMKSQLHFHSDEIRSGVMESVGTEPQKVEITPRIQALLDEADALLARVSVEDAVQRGLALRKAMDDDELPEEFWETGENDEFHL